MAFFETLITNDVITGVCGAIGEYLFGASADSFFDYTKARHKTKKILKADLYYLNQKLDGFDKSKQEFIKSFLLHNIYNDSRFLYPDDSMPEDRWGILREKFTNAYSIEFDDTPKNLIAPEKYEEILVDCVDHHNKLVVKYKLSDSQQVILQMLKKREYSNLLGYTGKTLNASSELQAETNEIDYSHLQLESILHALRMDLKHYKVLLLLSVAGMIIYAVIIAFASPHLVNASIFLMVAVVFIAVLLFLLFFSCAWRVHYYEKMILMNTSDLWNVQFKLYNDSLSEHSIRGFNNYYDILGDIIHSKYAIEARNIAEVNRLLYPIPDSIAALKEEQDNNQVKKLNAEERFNNLRHELYLLRDVIGYLEERDGREEDANNQATISIAVANWKAWTEKAIGICDDILRRIPKDE